jgi:hypothetical protein
VTLALDMLSIVQKFQSSVCDPSTNQRGKCCVYFSIESFVLVCQCCWTWWSSKWRHRLVDIQTSHKYSSRYFRDYMLLIFVWGFPSRIWLFLYKGADFLVGGEFQDLWTWRRIVSLRKLGWIPATEAPLQGWCRLSWSGFLPISPAEQRSHF